MGDTRVVHLMVSARATGALEAGVEEGGMLKGGGESKSGPSFDASLSFLFSSLPSCPAV